ncbi:unknown [Firmicutes bacterium CAG:94]|nr:unknown [Firmicutes bacterium CAG:94]
MTSFAPRMAWKVRRMRCSRAWTSTWMVTPSGMRSPSMRVRRISNSVSEEAGKPTSISRKPMAVSMRKNATFCSRSMGVTRAWLPSRKSTLHHTGAWVRVLPGQVRSARAMGWKGLYFRYPWFMTSRPFHTISPYKTKRPRRGLPSRPGRKHLRGTTRIWRVAPPFGPPCGSPADNAATRPALHSFRRETLG